MELCVTGVPFEKNVHVMSRSLEDQTGKNFGGIVTTAIPHI